MVQVTFADRAREPHPLVGIEASPSVDFRKLMDAIQPAAKTPFPAWSSTSSASTGRTPTA